MKRPPYADVFPSAPVLPRFKTSSAFRYRRRLPPGWRPACQSVCTGSVCIVASDGPIASSMFSQSQARRHDLGTRDGSWTELNSLPALRCGRGQLATLPSRFLSTTAKSRKQSAFSGHISLRSNEMFRLAPRKLISLAFPVRCA
jgi:hypothetical protein